MKTETDTLKSDLINYVKADLITRHGAGNVWDTDGLRENYSVVGFLAPFCVVTRKSDGQRGALEFTHSPRFYYNFIAD